MYTCYNVFPNNYCEKYSTKKEGDIGLIFQKQKEQTVQKLFSISYKEI